MENTVIGLDKFDDQVIKAICNAWIFSFVPSLFQCKQDLTVQKYSRADITMFVSGRFLYGNDYRKGLQRFSAAVSVFWDLFLLFCCYVVQDVA